MAAVELTGDAPRTTIIVLGASNVSRGLARLATMARARTDGPVDLFVSAGHGRSYGVNSRVAMRRLPSILASGLWRALDRERIRTAENAAPPLALVTDIGNDLLYGFSVEQVADWVRESVRRLAGLGTRVVITRLPLASIESVGPMRYRALRMLFVPGCRLPLAAMKLAAQELDARVTAIAAEHSAALVDQPGDWYGLDAIHVRRRRLDELWHAAGDAWGLAPIAAWSAATWRDWAVLGSQAAEVRSLRRRVRFTRQPVIDRESFRLWLH